MHPPSLRSNIGPAARARKIRENAALARRVNLELKVAAAGSVGVVDFGYLESFMAGDKAVVLEVLDLFRQQAATWPARLGADDPDWRDVVHTIKGASRGIGANALGDICERAEVEGAENLPAVLAGLEAVVADIAAYQAGA